MKPLKILFLSHSFAPAIGGIEASSELIVEALIRRGHKIIVMTAALGEAENLTYRVIRNPSLITKIKYHTWADLVYENNPCLRLGWPKLLLFKPSVVAIHTWISRPNGAISLIDKMKLVWLAQAEKVIAVSSMVQQRCWPRSIVIGNSYNHKVFSFRSSERKKDFVFLGRLVSDKGADLAIHAFGIIAFFSPVSEVNNATLTIIGDGPDRKELESLAATFPDPGRIKFLGVLKAKPLAAELNRHSFQFIPSVWEEPFGIVALEGIACGLIPIASDGGGLPDAVGKAGVIFKRGDLNSLVSVTTKLLKSDSQQQQCRRAASAHLVTFGMEAITNSFINVIESVATHYSS